MSGIDINLSGSTFIIIFIKNNQLFSVNIGDSRAVLGRKIINKLSWEEPFLLSTDHKPENKEEKSRIIGCGGGFIEETDDFGNSLGPNRVKIIDDKTYGLSMTRSIGDQAAKKIGVSCEPG